MDVDQALVRAHLEVLARVLVLERAADHAIHVLLGGQGHRPGDRRPGALRRLDDVARGLVDLLVVVALEANPDLVLSHVPLLHPFFALRYLMISVTAPAPTVRPPSRIANLRP